MGKIIVVAGGTGNLGSRIITYLLKQGAEVRALVRPESNAATIAELENKGVKVSRVNMLHAAEVAEVCSGADCVVSALSGLRDVIIDTQKVLLDAAVLARVPRFIPSDFSLDFTKLLPGENRNLDLRREFHTLLDKAPVAATTIFNGPFTELLTGEMPLILFKFNRILYYGSAGQQMDFTTMDNTAEFTAFAALDASAPRFLYIAGDQLSARQMKEVAGEVYGKKFGLLRPGGLGLLGLLIKVARKFDKEEKELYPAWQGMQYMHNMLSGKGKLNNPDNNRYPEIKWTTVKEFLISQNLK